MAIRSTNANEGIYLTANFPTITSYTAFFRFKRNATGTNNCQIYRFRNSTGAKYHEVGWIVPDSRFIIYSFSSADGINSYNDFGLGNPVVNETWYDCAVVQSGSGANTTTLYWGTTGSTTAMGTRTNTGFSTAQMTIFDLGFLSTRGQTFTSDVVMDNIKCWDVALTAAEIEMERAVKLPVRKTNLRYYFPVMTTTAADSGKDYSGNGFDATVNGTQATVDGAPVPYTNNDLTYF
jgi:hypothetical protein